MRFSSVVRLLGIGLLAALGATPAGLCQGNGHGVQVLALAPAVLAAGPGQILSLSFSVSNTSATEEEFVETLNVPEGWQSVIPMGSYRLGPGARRVRIVAVAVPRMAGAGQYAISYGVRSQRDYAIVDSATVTARVGVVSKLDFVPEEQPDVVLAGDAFTATVRLRNGGNVVRTLRVTTSTEAHYKVKLVPETLTLKPGGSGMIEVQVQSDPNESRTKNLAISLAATPTGEGGGAAETAYLVLSVEIVPRHPQTPDLYERLPVEVSTTLTGREGKSGLQVEVSGAGFLDEEHNQSLAFMVRQPNQQGASSLGRRDEMWGRYAQPNWAVGAGDLYYGLSYLTEQARYGRGLQFELRPTGPWSGKAYYLKSRWEAPALAETGAAVEYELQGGQRAQFNLLNKKQDRGLDIAGEQANLYSLALSTAAGARHQIAVEGALSKVSGGGSDTAYRITASGPAGKYSTYSFEKNHAGAEYEGAFRDADYLQVGVGSQLRRDLNGTVSFTEWEANLKRQAESGAAPHEQLWQMGLTYQLNSQWYVSGAWQALRRRDLMEPVSFDQHETVQRYSLGYSGGKLSGRLDAHWTRKDDRLTDVTSNNWAYTAYAGYQASDKLSLSGYASLSGNDSDQFSYLLGGSDTAGLSASWRPRANLAVDLSYSRYGADSASQQRNQLSGTVGYGISERDRVDFEARGDGGRDAGGQDIQYSLKYTRQFEVRTGKKKSVGELRGRVYDATEAGKPGLGNIIVTCSAPGVAAATRADGTFSFGGLKPGMYLVQLSRTSLGPTRTPEMKMPLAVEVKAGEVNMVEIGVYGAARVTGTVHIMRPAQSGEGGNSIIGTGATAYPEGPLADITVELRRDGEALRTMTNAQGQFVFDGLRPGDYHLTVYADNLPERHHVEKPEQDLDLAANAEVTLDIRVVPESRRIKMIDEGSIPSTLPVFQASVPAAQTKVKP